MGEKNKHTGGALLQTGQLKQHKHDERLLLVRQSLITNTQTLHNVTNLDILYA